jgi:hypothetical protein
MLSDYAFATDKWYWQVLTYILSIILSIVYDFFTMMVPLMYIEFFEKHSASITVKMILLWIVIFANIAFCVYTLQFVIRYTIELKKIRDIALLSIGGIIFIGISIKNFQ